MENHIKHGNLQFSCSVKSDSLQQHGLQHATLPCPSPTPGAYSNFWRWTRWCHPTILFSVVPFSSCLQSFPASGTFSNESVLHIRWPKLQLQHHSFQWIPRTDLLYDGLVGSLCSPRDSQESSPTLQFKSINFWCSAFFIVQLSHSYMTTGKTIALIWWTFAGKVLSLLFNMLSRLVIALSWKS